MRRPKTWLLTLALGLSSSFGQAAAPPADLVLVNARAYTVDASRSWASGLAIRGERLVYVGSDEGARRFVGVETEIVDLGGRLVLPAFHDSHVHPVSAGVEMGQCDLSGAADLGRVEQRVREWAAAHPEASWVVGSGWELPQFPNASPRRERLDTLVPDRPAILSAADGHSAWVNSAALAAARITSATPDPPRGRIERDPETGEPSGTLREAAIDLVASLSPQPTREQRLAGLRRALEQMNQCGIVAFQEASAEEGILDAYLTADREGWLTARVRVSLYVDPEQGVRDVDRLLGLRQRRSRHVAPDAAKLFLDGVIEARTAALLEPYLPPGEASQTTPENAAALFEPGALKELVTRLDREGFQVHMHAIGDAAIRMGLDAVAAGQAANGRRDGRHHLAHIQLFHPSDIPRFRQLGVVANFQPLWAYSDTYITDLTEPVLGPERSRWLYPVASLLHSGAVVAAGSDWSVSSVDPLDGIQVALTRRGLEAGPGEAWLPDQRASLPEMIAAYTIAGAYLGFEERDSGSLEPGKLADLVVLDHNLFEVAPHEIHEARVLWTLFEGATVWRDPAWSARN